jgi:hypothetical protein
MVRETSRTGVYCCPILQAAASFAAEDIWGLLEEYWLDEQTYDFSASELSGISSMDFSRVWFNTLSFNAPTLDGMMLLRSRKG